MAFWSGRGDWQKEDEGWRNDFVSEDEQEPQDALFSSLGDEETDSLQNEPMDDPFAVLQFETDMRALDLVERLSWDEGSSEEEEEQTGLLLPTLLTIEVPTVLAKEGESLQWSLISPCSDTASPRTLSPLTRLSISSPIRQFSFFEPEHEHEPSDEVIEEKQVIEEEEEQIAKECWSSGMNSDLSPPATKAQTNPFATYEVTENMRTENDAISENESDEEILQSALTSHPSLLPRVPSMARWRRQKARTCSGAGSAGMPTALSFSTFKARTRTLSRSRNQSMNDEDDGDFSSDDEGYTPELHLRRASETDPLGVNQWRRARHTSMSLSNHRLNVSLSPAMMTKRLQDARNKLNLLRSGSNASTATSEESFLDSPFADDIKSASAGFHREPSIFSDKTTSSSLVSSSSDEQQQPTRQQQLRAGVFKAAGFINSASAEAARKLRSRGFRAPQLPRQKTTSETEEEGLENFSPSRVKTSTVERIK